MKNTILSLLVACGLLLVGPPADAEPVDGQCNAIAVGLLGAVNQIDQEINVVNNCGAVLDASIAFMTAGCETGDGAIASKILPHGESCNLVATICDTIFTCFGITAGFCLDVAVCTNP